MNDVRPFAQGDLAHYDPDRGLKTIAVAEAAEKVAAREVRANPDDPLARQRLRDIVGEKLAEQRDYVFWRDKEVGPRRDRGAAGRGNKSSRVPAVALPPFDPGQDAVDRWRKALIKSDFNLALADAQDRAIGVCERSKSMVRGTEGTGEFERYTPEEYVEAVRAVLGRIDLDPSSCVEAQAVVKADRFFTLADDGLTQDWVGRVFLNPPYHRELIPLFIDKLLAEWTAGRTSAAILLTNNSTDTVWFQKAARCSDALCFPAGRINFWTPRGGDAVLPTQGQVFTYFGEDVVRFTKVFEPIGFVTP